MAREAIDGRAYCEVVFYGSYSGGGDDSAAPSQRIVVVKSSYRKFALFVRLGGEGKAHTYDKGCSQQLRLVGL
jgi:hypothetical protein